MTVTKNCAFARLDAQPIDDPRHGIAGVIHKQLAATQMGLAHLIESLASQLQCSSSIPSNRSVSKWVTMSAHLLVRFAPQPLRNLHRLYFCRLPPLLFVAAAMQNRLS
jgi:hypothetical protein